MNDVSNSETSVGVLIDFGDLDNKIDNCVSVANDTNKPAPVGCTTGILLDLNDVFGSLDSDTNNSNNNNTTTTSCDGSKDKCIADVTSDMKKSPENDRNWQGVNVLSPTSEVPLIENEIFDFDFHLSPADRENSMKAKEIDNSENAEDDDEEVFFGPVGHKEMCIAVNHELKKEEEEFKPLSPLSGEQYAEVFKEAISLSLFFEKCSIEDKEKKKKSSSDDENLLVKLGKLTMKNKVQNGSPTKPCGSVPEESVTIKSPRSPRRETFVFEAADDKAIKSPRSPRRETYVVGLSAEHEIPPALRQKNPGKLTFQGSSANQKRGIRPLQQRSKLGVASPHTFTARTAPSDCKVPSASSLPKQGGGGGGAAKSRLSRFSKLLKPGATSKQSPSAIASKIVSPPKRKRLNSAGSDEAMSETCSVTSDTSDCSSTTNMSAGKRPLPTERRTTSRLSGLKPPSSFKPPTRSVSSTSSSASSNSSFHSLNDSIKEQGKKTSGLPLPKYKPSLIRPSSLTKKTAAAANRTDGHSVKSSTGSRMSKPQPVKATMPVPHRATPTPGKVSHRVGLRTTTPKFSSITAASTPKTREKTGMPKRNLGSSLSSVGSTDSLPESASKMRSNDSIDSVFVSTPPTPMTNHGNSSRSKMGTTPQSISRRRSNIPTPLRRSTCSSVKSRFSSNASVTAPSPLCSPLARRTSSKHGRSPASQRSMPPPKFSIDDGGDRHTDNKENVQSTEKVAKNSPAVDMLIDLSDSPFKRQSPLRSTMTISEPKFDFTV